jgi:hypothetical protein
MSQMKFAMKTAFLLPFTRLCNGTEPTQNTVIIVVLHVLGCLVTTGQHQLHQTQTEQPLYHRHLDKDIQTG